MYKEVLHNISIFEKKKSEIRIVSKRWKKKTAGYPMNSRNSIISKTNLRN